MIVSAGVVKAFDHRNLDSTTLGGLLQSINYMPSASGGSWTLGTLVMNNFPQVSEIQDQRKLWNLTAESAFLDCFGRLWQSYHQSCR